MRLDIYPTYFELILSKRDTEYWANRPNKIWPLSRFSGKRLFCAFDRNGIYDITIVPSFRDDERGDADEFYAMVRDFVFLHLPFDHPSFCVLFGGNLRVCSTDSNNKNIKFHGV